jgi:hypothetical protein
VKSGPLSERRWELRACRAIHGAADRQPGSRIDKPISTLLIVAEVSGADDGPADSNLASFAALVPEGITAIHVEVIDALAVFAICSLAREEITNLKCTQGLG